MHARPAVHLAQYAGYRALTGLLARLPPRVRRGWGRSLGRLAWILLAERRRLTLDNLARALPELPPAARLQTARQCFGWQGELFLEQLWAMRRGEQALARFELVGAEHLRAAQARGKGMFLLTGHYGLWESAGIPIGQVIGKIHYVVRPQNNPYIAAEFERLRVRSGAVQIDRGRAGTRMLKVLKRGGAIGIAIDHRVRPEHALLVPFLGRLAWTSRLPAYLSTVTGCATLPVVCVPLPDGRYRVTVDPPILPEGEGEDEVERLTTLYSAALEPHVRARPELWLWLHSRWRRTRRHRRPEVLERLEKESRLPPASPLEQAARGAPAESPLRRLQERVSGDLLEGCGHLLLAGAGAGGESEGSRPEAPAARGTGPAVDAGDRGAGASRAAAALGRAFLRRGYAVRYFGAGALAAELARERDEGRLRAALCDLDRVPLVIVDEADPRRLSGSELELIAVLLAHRRDRGSVALAGAGADTWRRAAETAAGASAAAAIASFLDACESIDLSSLAAGAFEPSGAGAPRRSAAPDGEAEAPAL